MQHTQIKDMSFNGFENHITADDLIEQLKQSASELNTSNNDKAVITAIEDKLCKQFIMKVDMPNTSVWLLSNMSFNRTPIEAPLYKQLLKPLFGKSTPPTYKAKLVVNSLMNLPMEAEMSEIEQNDLNAGRISRLELKLIHLIQSLESAVSEGFTQFDVFNRTDTISNINEINSWLKSLNSNSTELIQDHLTPISLKDVLTDIKLIP